MEQTTEKTKSKLDQALERLNGPELEKVINLGECIGGFFAGKRALNLIDQASFAFDKDEANGLLILDSAEDKNDKLSNSYLMDITENAERRFNEGVFLPPEDRLNDAEFSKFKDTIKINHIMKFNEHVRDFISSVPDSRNSFGALRADLRLAFALATRKGSGYEKYNNFEDFKQDLYEVAEGMRHELAFREMICLTNEAIRMRDATDYQDSHGVDIILDVKISPNAANGMPKFATKSQIESGNYLEYTLPLDIKSTPRAARKKLEKQLSRGNPDHWVIWSNVYDEDFRLALNGSDPEIKYSKIDAPLALDWSDGKQIDVMKHITNKNILYGKEGERFIPKTLSRRISNIENEILKAIVVLKLEPISR